MGSRSVVLILILVFGILFSLLTASSYLNEESSNNFFRKLESKKADTALYRLVNPEKVCFSIKDEDLTKYGFLSILMREADSFVTDSPPSIHDNRYDGFGMGVNSSDVLPLIKSFQNKFHHTIENKVIRGYHDDMHYYDCNIKYNVKQYNLRIEFRSLDVLDQYSGFVPISISKEGIVATTSSARFSPDEKSLNNFRDIANPSNLNVFLTFNNTVVWTNDLGGGSTFSSSDLSLWAKLTLNTTGFEGEKITVSTQIPPGKSWDYRLAHNYKSIEPTVYDYLIEGEKISTMRGKIAVNFYPTPCMVPEEAKSLYGQSGFDMRFPTYLPDGYEYKCGVHYDHFMLVQTYWNRSIDEMEDFPNSSTHDSALNNGVIQIFAAKAVRLWYDWADKTAEERMKELTEGEISKYYLEPRLVEIGVPDEISSIEAVAYQRNLYDWKDINILEVYDRGDSGAYFLKGKVPIDELVKMAQSMYLN